MRINKTLSNKTISGGVKITNTKNRKNRNIIIPVQARELILGLYATRYPNWFVFGAVKHVSGTYVRRKLGNCIIKVNNELEEPIPHVTHHEFGRHSHASLLLSVGLTYDEIGSRLGDTSSGSLIEKTYAHLLPQAQTKIIDKLDPKNIDRLMNST